MVKFLLNMKALIMVAVLGMTAQSVSAMDFYFKVTATAEPTGAGKVYVTNVNEEKEDFAYAATSEDDGAGMEMDEEATETLCERELWAKPNPGFAFVGWSTAEDPTTILSTERHYTVSDLLVTSTDPENRTTFNYIAHFEERPVVPEFSAIVSGEEYYLYNKEYGVFLVGGNDWGTRASVSDEKGLKVKISEVEGGTYQLGAMSPDNADGVWIDGSRDGNNQFVLTMNADNTFSIGCTKFPNTVLAWNGDVANTRLNFVAGATATWAAVSQEAYDAYLEAASEIIAFKKQPENLTAIAARENLINSTNIYDAAEAQAFADKTAEMLALVNDYKYTETIVNPNAATGWHASTDYNFLLTPWTIGGEKANNFDKALYINTWSVEGVSDGSDFLVPFLEYWTGDDASLGATELATTIENLTPGYLYNASVWARVRIKNGSVENAHGITFSAGESSVDVCAGEQVGDSQFRIIKANAIGAANAEGKLKVSFNVAADNNISWLSYKDVYVASYDVKLSDMAFSVAEDQVIDEDGDFMVKLEYTAEFMNEATKSQIENFEVLPSGMATVAVYDEAGNEVSGNTAPWDIDLNENSRNIYLKNLNAGNTYTVKVTDFEVVAMDLVNDGEITYNVFGELPSLTFTVPSAPELAVSLIANDSVEYALNTHSTVTIDQAITAIKVAGLDQVMDSVTYAIYGMDKATLAEGLLSVNTIGYAEFAPVTLYEGNQYNVVIAIKDSVLFDQIVIGAAEPAEIEIAATLNNGKTALNTHSSVSAEVVNNFEVSFDGVVPMQAGYSISTMKQEADSTGTVWVADSTLAQGALSLSGKGYAELEEPVFLLAGTKYLLVVSYQTFDGQNGYAEFQIDGACEDPSAINAIATSANANGKFLENGKIVIVKNGKKYNVAGSIVK